MVIIVIYELLADASRWGCKLHSFLLLFNWIGVYDTDWPGGIIRQWNIISCCVWHSSDWGRTYITLWIHKIQYPDLNTSYGCFFAKIWRWIDHVIPAPNSIILTTVVSNLMQKTMIFLLALHHYMTRLLLNTCTSRLTASWAMTLVLSQSSMHSSYNKKWQVTDNALLD